MKTLLLLLFLLGSVMSAQSQQALRTGYFFFTEEGFHKIEQSHDTLYTYRCLKDMSCSEKPESHYKIVATERLADSFVLKLERLDSIPMTPAPYPEDRFSVLTLKDVNDKTLSFIIAAKRYTASQIDTLQVQESDSEGKFSFTYYSKAYLDELSKRKQISSKGEIEAVLKLFQSPAYQKIIEVYKKSDVKDIYSVGLMTELWHKAVIESGYNPLGSRDAFNRLMR